MTREELEKTEWAKAFKDGSPVSYEKALDYAMMPKLKVDIRKGFICDCEYEWDWEWVITPESDPDFYLYSKRLKRQAIEFCIQMGWRIPR